jgi:hypothetical protein
VEAVAEAEAAAMEEVVVVVVVILPGPATNGMGFSTHPAVMLSSPHAAPSVLCRALPGLTFIKTNMWMRLWSMMLWG